MANTRSGGGGASRDGASDASASAAFSTPARRETRSSSAVTPTNLRRSTRETKGKKKSDLATTPAQRSTKATKDAAAAAAPPTPVPLPKNPQGDSTTPTRKSTRVKTATSPSSKQDSTSATAKRKNANDPQSAGSGSLSKKNKRLSSKSYIAFFKEHPTSSPVLASPHTEDGANASKVQVEENGVDLVENASKVKVEENDADLVENASKVQAEENGADLVYEESDAHEEVSQEPSDVHDLEAPSSGLDENPEAILEGDKMKVGCHQADAISESHMPSEICSLNKAAEIIPVMEAGEQTAGVSNHNSLPESLNGPCSTAHHKDASKAIEDSDSIGTQEACTSMQTEAIQCDETDYDDPICVVCRSRNVSDILKSCDGKGCKRHYHLSCIDPPLEHVSPGIWYCVICTKRRIQFGVYSVCEGIDSLWDVKDGPNSSKQYFVKYKNLAHVHNQWVSESDVIDSTPQGRDLISKFCKRIHKEKTIRWKQEWAEPHRLLKKRSLMPQNEAEGFFKFLGDKFAYCNAEWLVKWKDLGYEHATWELETSSFLCTPEAEELKRSYESRCREAARRASVRGEIDKVKDGIFQKLQRLPDGCPAGLDDNHLNSINRLREFWHNSRGAIFIDDQPRPMATGMSDSAAALERVIRTIPFVMSILPDVCRPLLIVSTSASLSVWEAKFNRLAASINVVVYNGEKDVRKSIQDLEFYDSGSMMLQVLLSHPDAILEDIEAMEKISWEAVIVDDCQSSRVSKCLGQLKRLPTYFRMVLLTSPLKESIPEYINLLSFLNPEENDVGSVSNGDSGDTAGTLAALKAKLACCIAFERKADSSMFSEYWVPAHLTQVQLEMYCYTLLSNSPALRSHSKTDNVGALRNILISLRKCCDHPYLVDQSLQSSLTKGHLLTEILDIGVHSSGKLLLLDKMLQKLRIEGLRVLILCQSAGGSGNPMGDILDDFINQRFGYEAYERVERGLLVQKKQTAMMEEKALILAKHDQILDSNIQNISPSLSHCLLSWGASFLFNRLDKFQNHNYSSNGSDGDKLFMDNVELEVSTKLSTKVDVSTENDNSVISQAHLHGSFYSSDIVVIGEREGISSPDGDLPKFWAYWLNLLDGRSPQWQHISEPAQRSRRKLQNMDEPLANIEEQLKVPVEETDIARMKRRKLGEIMDSSPKVAPGGNKDTLLSEDNTPSSSYQTSVDDTWQELETNNLHGAQRGLHIQLKPELLKLCQLLELPETVKSLCEELLEYILKNHQVSPEPKGLLHAFNIALCWRAASLLKHKVNRSESLALAVKNLNYDCSERVVLFVYEKLRILKKKFARKAGEMVSGEKDLSDTGTRVGQHLSKDELLSRVMDKRIKLVDKVFSLRGKSIQDKHVKEAALLDTHRQREVAKLREACNIVVKHVRESQSHIDQEDMVGKIKLIVEWFTMLLYAFLKHMRCQCTKLDMQQSAALTKESQLKEQYLQAAKSGQLDRAFDQHIPLPDSDFVVEEFSHFREEVGGCHVHAASLTPQSLGGDSAMEITLVRSVNASEVTSTEEVRNGSVIQKSTSEAVSLTVNRIHDVSDGIDSQGDASLAVRNPIIDDSANQESLGGDHGSTEHVEEESTIVSPLQSGTSQPLGDAGMEVNAENSETVVPHLNTPASSTPSSQAVLPTSREIETQTNLVTQSAQQSLASLAPSQLSPGEPEREGSSGVASAQPLQSERAQSIPVSSSPLVIAQPDQSQPSPETDAAPNSAEPAQLFPVASMMFNHPPVHDEPLKNEMHKLRLHMDTLNKMHELKKSELRRECEQELEKIKQKYDLLIEEHDSTHILQKKTLDDIYEKVLRNQSLAEDFRAKFISPSAAQARAHSPQARQAPQQASTRHSAAGSSASPVAPSSACRPPVPRHRVQPPQVDRPSLSQVSRSPSLSSQVGQPALSVPGNLVRATSAPVSHMPTPRGGQGELAPRAPAPHLQIRPPRSHSMPPGNRQQLPRLETTSSRTQLSPVAQGTSLLSSSQPALVANPSTSDSQQPTLAMSAMSNLPATLSLSGLHPVTPASSVGSGSSHTAQHAPSTQNAALQATAPAGLSMMPCTSSATSGAGRRVGPSTAAGMQATDSVSESLDAWITTSVGLNSDVDVVCLSDDDSN
ncbi:hypothetical protein EJB05_46596 [Eragrostis curvula]|uniref:PHD-type domain-containing protein n=1 Tax=Eragrostis curvula TaxID=38414 RepID=A0A5J9TND7_9POAL|nr:hypothetical protein EJB05_46596 [Eragrostis curvula]